MTTLTETQVKVFEYIERMGRAHDGIQRSALASFLWPGRRSGNLNGYAKSAGSLLGKYRKAGWITSGDCLTQKAKDALEEHRARAG